MSEQMNRPEAELNEQALEGVSGGNIQNAGTKAQYMCNQCRRTNSSKKDCPHMTDLRLYFEKNGLNSVRLPEQCPCFNL